MLTSLIISSFRGAHDLSLELSHKNYILGANGSGKTHILDAIHLLGCAEPTYGSHSLSSGERIIGYYDTDGLIKKYGRQRDDTREIFMIQDTRITKPKYISSLPFRSVHISPFDMNLLYFAPSMRRDYIDSLLDRTYEQFGHTRRDFEATMRQRNALLKKIREGTARREDLRFWDQKYAEYADTYSMYRDKYRHFVTNSLSLFPHFFGTYPLIYHYESSWIDQENRQEYIRTYLEKNQDRDIITGHTHIGPHRDDWGFRIQYDSMDEPIQAETYLSRGEMKMLLLGLKMIELTFLKTQKDIPVILLIDDIFAELDDKNSLIFLNSLTTHQVILTSQKPLPNHEKYHDFICIKLGNM